MKTDEIGGDCSVAFQPAPSNRPHPPKNHALESLWPSLGRKCAFYPTLAAAAGSIKAGVLLSQLWYWTTRHAESTAGDCWIWKTSEQWQAETGLTVREQANARERLCSLGLIEVRRQGVPARLHCRLLVDALASQLKSRADSGADNPEAPAMESIVELLGKSQPHYRILTALTDNLHAGLLLSRALQGIRFARRSDEAAGRLRLSRRSGEALGLTRREWEGARRHLVAFGFWTERLAGVPARLEICVDLDRLQVLLAPLVDKADAIPVCGDTAILDAQNVQTSMWPDRNLVLPKPPNKLCGKRPTSYAETAHLYKTLITDNSVLQPTAPVSETKKPDSGAWLIFPAGLLPDEREAASRLLLECGSDAQILLDELTGRIQTKGIRHSAVGYLRALVQRWRAGTFIPERAQQVAAARLRQEATEKARQHTRIEADRAHLVDSSPEGQRRKQERRADIAQLRETLRRGAPKVES